MFLQIAHIVSKRGTCNRLNVGAIAVVGDHIASSGYVGAPSGQDHCTEVECEIGNGEGCIRTVHAEANVIAWAAAAGIALYSGILYSTHSPCLDCAKLIINAGFYKVVFRRKYRDLRGIDLLLQMGVEVSHDGHAIVGEEALG